LTETHNDQAGDALFRSVKMNKSIALTGDRTTGQLHLGHYAGSLRKRVEIQETHNLLVMLADTQALTDNGANPAKLRDNVLEVMADYLAVGLDPGKTTIFLQSAVRALPQLSMYYLNLVTVSRLERNPTIKAEIIQKGMEKSIPAGFLCYPAAQAADITAFKATVVPVGEDQLPMIEQANEIVAKINRIAGRDILPTSKALLSDVGRLPGLDGKAKASKSLGNAIPLGCSSEDLKSYVMSMYTDPDHLKVSDPGRVEGNAVFAYLDAFDPERDELEELKRHYRKGGLGDMALKRRLLSVLEDLLSPVREKRKELLKDKSLLLDFLREGTLSASRQAEDTLGEIEEAFGLIRIS
jgi:tryptophanyl-tRNA synthetase